MVVPIKQCTVVFHYNFRDFLKACYSNHIKLVQYIVNIFKLGKHYRINSNVLVSE